MQKLKAVAWSTKNAFRCSPIIFIIYIFMQLAKSTFLVYTSVLLGDIINDVLDIISESKNVNDIAVKLVIFGMLNVIIWVIVELRWRLSDDYIPLRNEVGATKYLIKLASVIPLRKWDSSEFCDRFERFSDCVMSQYRGLKNQIGSVNIIYSTVLSCVYLAGYSLYFIPVLIIAIIVCISFSFKNAKIDQMVWEDTTNPNRRANYLRGMFFGIYNRETRVYGLADTYISQWKQLRSQVIGIEHDGTRKTEKAYAIINYICTALCPLVMIGLAIVLVKAELLKVGCVIAVWNLTESALSGAFDTSSIVEDLAAYTEKSDEAYTMYLEIKSYESDMLSNDCKILVGSPAIEIDHASFAYTEENNVLDSISLKIEKGEVVALLGENGSGKSTLIKLILGMYKPIAGTVCVYGNSAYGNEKYIRNNISAAFQDYCTYPFTVRENVGFGDIENISNDTKITNSLKLVHMADLIDNDSGLDTVLGRTLEDSGIDLSGGQWQKIAMARALFGAKGIMIFDEPTAKLDPLAEEEQFNCLIENARKSGNTLILVSHRAGFARMADRIICLKNGKIVETGTHNDLIKHNGYYTEMFNAQRAMYATNEVNEV